MRRNFFFSITYELHWICICRLLLVGYREQYRRSINGIIFPVMWCQLWLRYFWVHGQIDEVVNYHCCSDYSESSSILWRLFWMHCMVRSTQTKKKKIKPWKTRWKNGVKYFFRNLDDWPVEYVIYTATIPCAFTGGDVSIFASAFAYISDISDVKNRTLRVTILEVCYLITFPIGITLGSYLFNHVFNHAYIIMFSLNGMFLLLAIFYSVLNLKVIHERVHMHFRISIYLYSLHVLLPSGWQRTDNVRSPKLNAPPFYPISSTANMWSIRLKRSLNFGHSIDVCICGYSCWPCFAIHSNVMKDPWPSCTHNTNSSGTPQTLVISKRFNRPRKLQCWSPAYRSWQKCSNGVTQRLRWLALVILRQHECFLHSPKCHGSSMWVDSYRALDQSLDQFCDRWHQKWCRRRNEAKYLLCYRYVITLCHWSVAYCIRKSTIIHWTNFPVFSSWLRPHKPSSFYWCCKYCSMTTFWTTIFTPAPIYFYTCIPFTGVSIDRWMDVRWHTPRPIQWRSTFMYRVIERLINRRLRKSSIN